MKNYFLYALLFVFSLSVTSCSDDQDDTQNPKQSSSKDFVWRGLNLWYFWQDEIFDLSDNRFNTENDYQTYLSNFNSPEALFNNLKSQKDRFSWIIEDYNELNNSLNGINKSNGMEFSLYTINNSSDLMGVVRYILPSSSASATNLKRGDIFLTVNGTQLTTSNYSNLLFSDRDIYTIGLADTNFSNIFLTGETVTLTKELYEENPIFKTNTFTENGIKIGYLMYNSFTANYDQQLNDVFGQFKAEGVQELIVDLRYNPGGRVSSATALASMISGKDNTQLFTRQRWNNKLQGEFTDQELNLNFITQLTDGTSINTLNLNTVHIIAQRTSASASELVINGLNPYITVIHIGDRTLGKNKFSIPLYDNPDCAYSCDTDLNPDHTWAMQPIVGALENANGFYQYEDGLPPTFELKEDPENYGILGQTDEPLLARAIQDITGEMIIRQHKSTGFKELTHSNFETVTRDNMYLDTKDIPVIFKQN